MMNPTDLRQINSKGISEEQINRQLEEFKLGFLLQHQPKVSF